MWIKEPELWRLIFTPLSGGLVIFESVCGVWRTVAIKFWHLLNVWKCFGGNLKEWHYSCHSFKFPPKHFHTFNRCQNLIATVLHTPQTLSKITEPPDKGVKINLHSSGSLIHKCQNYFPLYIYHPLQVFSSSLLMKTSCLRLKLVELNFLVSFNTDDQSKTDVANAINIITYKSKSSRWTFSIK